MAEAGPLALAIQDALEQDGFECERLGTGECEAPGTARIDTVDTLVLVAVPNSSECRLPFARSMGERGYGRIIHVTERALGLYPDPSVSLGVTENVVVWSVLEGVNSDKEDAPGRLRRSALGRAVFPNEVAATVAFLASTGAAYVTGVNLSVTGGFGLGLFPEQLG
jgi:hypothetical protein